MIPKFTLHSLFVLCIGALVSGCTGNVELSGASAGLSGVREISTCPVETGSSTTNYSTTAGPADKTWNISVKTEADIPAAIAAMTLQEKVGQMVQTDIAAATAQEIREYNIGSIISLIPEGKLGTTQAWRALAF